MSRPRLLDLFCCAGGAGMGYHRAGFEVVGVDVRPQPNYPFTFHEGDALECLRDLVDNNREAFCGLFDAIHASPPCQVNSSLRHLHPGTRDTHPDLVGPTRELLEKSGLPWVMENVPGADMQPAIILCGSMFGLGADCRDGQWRQLRRHRWFETSFPLFSPTCQHQGEPVGVYGTGGGGPQTRGYRGYPGEYEQAMGIDWGTRAEIAQAIPPAYTEYIGGWLLNHIVRWREAA